jgi:hypothetical protein
MVNGIIQIIGILAWKLFEYFIKNSGSEEWFREI